MKGFQKKVSNIDVSVVVATYKQEKYIAMTLDSILAQKFSGTIEVLVGDDCSPDNTGAIVKEYGEKYPDIIKSLNCSYIKPDDVTLNIKDYK